MRGDLVSDFLLLKPGPTPQDWQPTMLRFFNFLEEDCTALDSRGFGDSIEYFMRCMVANCTLGVSIPAPSLPHDTSPRRYRKLLPPSLASRLRIVDRNKVVFRAVCRYLSVVAIPEVVDAPRGSGLVPRRPFDYLTDLICSLYKLVLALKNGGACFLNPRELAEPAVAISSAAGKRLSAEARTRLDIVRGLAGFFELVADIPCFQFKPGLEPVLRERADEILEDAYLLEASRIKRFLGLRAGLTAVKRDLRNLLSFIVKRRKWAKGLLQVSEAAGAIPPASTAVTDTLMEALPTVSIPTATGVLLLDFDSVTQKLGMNGPLLVHTPVGGFIRALNPSREVVEYSIREAKKIGHCKRR